MKKVLLIILLIFIITTASSAAPFWAKTLKNTLKLSNLQQKYHSITFCLPNSKTFTFYTGWIKSIVYFPNTKLFMLGYKSNAGGLSYFKLYFAELELTASYDVQQRGQKNKLQLHFHGAK